MATFNDGLYNALDRFQGEKPEKPQIEGETWSTSLGPRQIGVSTNPFQHQTQALGARIREGAGRIEINLPGAGKSSAQSPSPEAYGRAERMDMREMVKAAGVKTSTHATFQRQGLSGLGEKGFNDEVRWQNIKEVKKAIQFAAEATTGGAIVFHTGEWQRPMSEHYGKGKDKFSPDAAFKAYDEESDKATFYMVDERTGNFVSAISKDQELFRPVYLKAKDLAADKVGKYDELKGAPLEAGDFVDVNGHYIDESNTERLFQRVPKWDEKHTNFEVQKVTWDDIELETKEYNKKHDTDIKPEQMFVNIQVENQILQAKGSSLFHAQRYDEERYAAEKVRDALTFYKKIDESLPEDEKWKIMTQRYPKYLGSLGGMLPGDTETITQALERQLKELQDAMRYVHEASASADAQAKERQQMLDNIKPVDVVGMEKSTKSIAELGMYAYDYTRKHEKDLDDPLYIAPENWQASQYGGHPQEMIDLITKSREAMEKRLGVERGMDSDAAKRLAKTHIKSTIDIGHLNLWRAHFQAKKGESEDSRDKRFNKWALDWTKEMIDKGIIGHIHIADNLGWDDEHLTPGEGNAPITEFIHELEKAGYKDFIVEGGSFNADRIMLDTMRHIGSPIYSTDVPHGPRMGNIRHQHFGYAAPSNYIVGAYSPSNEWRLWSEVPLE